jgi:hypothetical protein
MQAAIQNTLPRAIEPTPFTLLTRKALLPMSSANTETLSTIVKVTIASLGLSVAIKLLGNLSIATPPSWVAAVVIVVPSLVMAGWMAQKSKGDHPVTTSGDHPKQP